MPTKLKVGDAVRYQGEDGTVTDVVEDLKCVRVKFAADRVMRIPWDQVQEAPSHKQVKGPGNV